MVGRQGQFSSISAEKSGTRLASPRLRRRSLSFAGIHQALICRGFQQLTVIDVPLRAAKVHHQPTQKYGRKYGRGWLLSKWLKEPFAHELGDCFYGYSEAQAVHGDLCKK
jgi:hypothetical protein